MAQTDRQTQTQTHRQTDGHGDSMTNSAQWGQVGENPLQLAHSGYQDTKIFGTKVWGGSFDFNLNHAESPELGQTIVFHSSLI